MTFSEKLKQAMQELHLNQRQVCGMTGKSKGSVSQYLSGKQIPSEDVQSAIAVALGLESDYFSKSDEQVVVLPTAELRNGVIPRLDVEKAAKLLQMNHNTVRKGLQQGVFPWGYGIHTSDNRWVYFIGAIGSRDDFTTFFRDKDNEITVKCGCFLGKIDKFLEKVTQTHGDSKYALVYKAAVEVARLQIDLSGEAPKDADE